MRKYFYITLVWVYQSWVTRV